jgi:hypothetical protein
VPLRIVGWRCTLSMPSELPLDAPYTSNRYATRLADVGTLASIGSVGDCCSGEYR